MRHKTPLPHHPDVVLPPHTCNQHLAPEEEDLAIPPSLRKYSFILTCIGMT